jgi:hypothetical protein
MTCTKFEPVLSNIDTTETSMLALQGNNGNAITRLPWAIWLNILRDGATKIDKKTEIDLTPNV